MRVTVRLSRTDLEMLDDIVRNNDLQSRSEAIRRMVHIMRDTTFADDYAAELEDYADEDEAPY